MLKGVDISNWQTDCNPANLDVDFCIVKATEGLGYTDPYCDKFVSACIESGKLWGFYHFARENSPEDEADYFYNECAGYIGHGVPVLDYETENADNREWCERFMTRFHDLSGIWPLLYISAYRCTQYASSWIPDKCGLWIAGYPSEIYHFEDAGEMPYSTSPWEFAAIWQFSSTVYINGYSNALDGDLAYMDANAWMKYAKSDSSAPEPAPSKSVDDYVLEVLLGEYGNDDERKRLLGDKYEPVQARINELYEIAEQVINGDWGNGWNRERAINGAGYPYELVQRIVNSLLD